MPIHKWFAKLLAPAPRRLPHRRGRARPVVEGLECRVVPSTFNEMETNNTPAQANTVVPGTGDVVTVAPIVWLNINGAVSTAADADYYKFTLINRSGVFFDIDSRDTGLSTTLDSVLTLFDSTGTTQVGANDDGYDFDGFDAPLNSVGSSTSLDSSLYADLAPGTYFIRVTSAGATAGAYQLRVLADTNYTTTAPVLNSRPAATDTFFLDFNGHSATDAFGTYTATPYDFNNNAGEFSPAERLAIRNVWSVVTEDYSPFNVNVSTVQPTSFADGVAHRHVITNSPPTIVGQTAGTLGVALLGSYATGGPSDNVAFTFASGFGPFGGGVSGDIMATPLELGNTTSHEIGHTLGLQHYATSTGSAGLADVRPNAIMASPDVGLNRETFATGINEIGAAQTDLNVIGSPTNTFGSVPDDFGGSIATAGSLTQVGFGYTASGIISSTPDVDYFRFLAGGATTISVDVNDYVSNLNATVSLIDSTGATVAVNDPMGSFDASITQTLPAGTYYLVVGSSGGTGEVGKYSVTITTSLTVAPIVTTTAGPTPYATGGPAAVVDSALTVTDVDSPSLTGAIVQITGGYVNGEDVLAAPSGNGVLSVFDPASGTLTLFGITTIANYQAALAGVTYTNIGATPTAGTRTLTFNASDSSSPGPNATKTVVVGAPPVVRSTTGTTSFTEGGTATAIDAGVTVTDADSPNLMGATVQITGGYASGQDVLAFTDANGITGAFNATTGTLTLSGSATVANYQTALQAVTYINTSNDPSLVPRTVTFIANDGIIPSTGATKTIIVSAVNETPVNMLPAGPLVGTEDTALTVTGMSIADPDSGTGPVSVTLSATRGTLTVNTTVPGGLLLSQTGGNGTKSVTVVATRAAINATLAAGVRYTPDADFNGTDALVVATDDRGSTGGLILTDTDALTITLGEVNDAPIAGTDFLSPLAAGAGVQSIPFATLTGNDRPGPTNESGQTLTVTAVGGAVGGTVAIVGGAVQFTPAADFTGTPSFTYTIGDNGTTNGAADPKTGTGTVFFGTPPSTDAPPPAAPAPTNSGPAVAFGFGAGFPSLAALIDPRTGAVRVLVDAFPGFRGGVSTAVGDVNGDGVADLIVAAGPGGPAVVKVYDGRNGNLMRAFAGFPTGTNVAAGDVNGDGSADFILGSASGGGIIAVLNGRDLSLLSIFAPFGALASGIRVGSGDLNGDGIADVYAAPVGIPVFAVFSGRDRSFLGFGLPG